MITLDLLKTYLWITDCNQDTLLALFVNSANGKIKSMIGYDPTAQWYVKKIDGNAQHTIITKERPLNSVAYLRELDWWVYVAVDWEFYFKPSGVIHLEFLLLRWLENYEISYNAGYAEDSIEMWEIQMIWLQYASMMYNSKWSNGVKSESVSGDSITWWVNDFDFSWLYKFRDV
jgi:hypothetical protein